MPISLFIPAGYGYRVPEDVPLSEREWSKANARRYHASWQVAAVPETSLYAVYAPGSWQLAWVGELSQIQDILSTQPPKEKRELPKSDSVNDLLEGLI